MVICFTSLWTLGLVIGCQILTSRAIDTVPILMWDHNGKTASFEPFNPLHTTSQIEFEEIMKGKLEMSLPPLLVLVQDIFCSEDFTLNKKNLMDLKNASVTYLSAVKSPVSFFENLSSYEQLKEPELESIGDSQLAIVNVKNMDDALKTYKDIRESSPNLVTVLTGYSCTFNLPERVRRATEAEIDVSNDTSLFLNVSDGKVLLYSSQFPFIKTSQNGTYEQFTSFSDASDVKIFNNSMILTLTFKTPSDPKIALKFNFTMSQGYYKLVSLMCTDANHTKEFRLSAKKQLFIPQSFSYNCGHDIIFKNDSINGFNNDTVNLKFTDLQIQLDAKGTFGDSYDCIGFTTIPIWTGIFVTVILGLIMIWGLTMIVDIRTMDRFDDPKGKIITISTLE